MPGRNALLIRPPNIGGAIQAGQRTNALRMLNEGRQLSNALTKDQIDRLPVTNAQSERARGQVNTLRQNQIDRLPVTNAQDDQAFTLNIQQNLQEIRQTASREELQDAVNVANGIQAVRTPADLEILKQINPVDIPADLQFGSPEFETFRRTAEITLDTLSPETFGRVLSGADAQGAPAFGQVGNRGTVRGVEGLAPSTARQLTQSQIASNAEIDDARQFLSSIQVPEGSTLLQEVRRLGASSTDTGRDNRNFDPLIQQAFNKARRRKVGGDDGFGAFIASLRASGRKQAVPLPGGNTPDQTSTGQQAQGPEVGQSINLDGKDFVIQRVNDDGSIIVSDPQTGEFFAAGK